MAEARLGGLGWFLSHWRAVAVALLSKWEYNEKTTE